ncbi:MAG: transposase [Chloroflexi bacterium]|nr:transposase [Chloroflexota bacterium]
MTEEKGYQDILHRRSVRLKGYDYAQEGAYFVTICTRDRECMFGDEHNGEIRLNQYGLIVREEWLRTAELRENAKLEACVVMPNHLHGIIAITNRRGVSPYAPTGTLRSPSHTLGAIVRGFKSASTKLINETRHTPGTPVWQRNYYEHVIRDEDDLQRIQQYILDNPAHWAEDENHPLG